MGLGKKVKEHTIELIKVVPLKEEPPSKELATMEQKKIEELT